MSFSEVRHDEVSASPEPGRGAAGLLERQGGRVEQHDVSTDRVRLSDEWPAVREQRGGLLPLGQRVHELPEEVAPPAPPPEPDYATLLRALANSSAPLMRYERAMLRDAAREFERLSGRRA